MGHTASGGTSRSTCGLRPRGCEHGGGIRDVGQGSEGRRLTYDVVIVGARIAGASLAIHLRRAGLSVALIDRATFPSDTPSTHIFQAEGSGCLARLGVLDRVLDAGAPWVERLDMFFEGLHMREPWQTLPTDPGPALCVRRPVLDSSLVEAAESAGANLHTSTRVVDVLRDDRSGRVAGVRTTERAVPARLVVGADGMNSTVARLVGARRYHVVPNGRFSCWAYFEGAAWDAPAALMLYRQDDDFVFGIPADSGLYLASAVPSLSHLDRFRADPEAAFARHIAVWEPIAATLAGAKRVGRLHFLSEYPLFFRESAGLGWVLVGDAGHFKDPAGAQGISDALRQSELLASAIVQGTDQALAGWWKWRDRDAIQVHWFAADLGAAGRMSPVAIEMLQRLGSTPEGRRQFIDLLNHRLQPSQVLTPRRLLAPPPACWEGATCHLPSSHPRPLRSCGRIWPGGCSPTARVTHEGRRCRLAPVIPRIGHPRPTLSRTAVLVAPWRGRDFPRPSESEFKGPSSGR